jgi:Subtilase family/FG-GAP-like repeat
MSSRRFLSMVFLLSAMIWPAFAGAQPCSGRPGDTCPRGGLTMDAGRTQAGQSADSQKVAPALREAAAAVQDRMLNGKDGSPPDAVSTDIVRVNPAGEIHVYVILTEFRPEHVAALAALGLGVELTLPDFQLVQGWLPAAALDAIAALDFVKEVRPPGYPTRHIGAQLTAGDAVHRASTARSTLGLSGHGVKVGVMSDGVDHLANAVASGDLPPQVEILKNARGDEGTAMLEIVHDLAPGAALAFYGPTTSADMVVGINQLAASGARVIVDDLTFSDEPKFQDGMIAQAARNFATGGRVYVTSAGNQAQRHYRAPYVRTPGNATYPFFHNYASGGIDIGNSLSIGPGCTLRVVLQWNNPNGVSRDDFDLFLLRASDSAVLGRSINFQTGTQNAYEDLSFTNPTGAPLQVFIAIAEFSLASASSSLVVDYFVYPSCGIALEYVTSANSVIGHAAVSEVLSVAAVNVDTPTLAESYSSRGPGSISFPVPQNRPVPNISAVDCVTTQVGALGVFLLPFCGTSAAAPHVAAMAALVIERNSTLTSQQIRDVLMGTAIDLGPPGFDFTFGSGRADALGAALATPRPVFTGGVYVATGRIVTPGGPAEIVTGAGAGGGPHVRVFQAGGAPLGPGFMAYDPAFTGGVRVAACDVDGDGRDEIVTAPGAGGGPHVRVFRLDASGNPVAELAGFFAYHPAFTGGVFVACGDVDADGVPEIITGADAGGGPHVRILRIQGGTVAAVFEFFAYHPSFRGGVRVAAGNLDGSDRASVITAAGPGGGPHVRAIKLFTGGGTVVGIAELASFFAYAPTFTGGVFVASGNVTGDGRSEIITGADAGGGPHVRVLSGTGADTGIGFFAYHPAFTGGVRVASGNLVAAGPDEIVTAAGPTGSPHVLGFTGAGGPTGTSFFAY